LYEWLGDDTAVLVPCHAVFDYRLIRQIRACSCQDAHLFSAVDGEETGIAHGPAAFLWRVLQKPQETVPTDSLSYSLTSEPQSFVSLKTGLWAPLAAGQEEVEQRLLASLGRDTDGFLSRALDRKVSQALTHRLVRTAVTPNQITLLSFLLGMLSVWLLATPDYWERMIGAVLFLASVIIDGCDGELARLKHLESDFGAKFDWIADNVVHLLLFPGIALGLYRETHLPLYATLAGVTLFGVLCSIAVTYLVIFRSPTGLATTTGKRAPIAEFYERLAGRDFAYILLVLAVVNKLHWFLWATAIGTYLFAGGLLVVYLAQRYKAVSEQ
jgi:phosphatidylglycerophosphate synthase